jgi:hypothetical protein
VAGSVVEFWLFLKSAFGSAFPWVIVLAGCAAIALLFHGRVAAKWLFPSVLVMGAAWAIQRWLWYYF